jgi:hypothetical protein
MVSGSRTTTSKELVIYDPTIWDLIYLGEEINCPSTTITNPAQAKPDNHKNRKIDGTDFLSAEGRPCPHWSTLKTDQEGRRRQVLVVHSRGSTIARTPF